MLMSSNKREVHCGKSSQWFNLAALFREGGVFWGCSCTLYSSRIFIQVLLPFRLFNLLWPRKRLPFTRFRVIGLLEMEHMEDMRALSQNKRVEEKINYTVGCEGESNYWGRGNSSLYTYSVYTYILNIQWNFFISLYSLKLYGWKNPSCRKLRGKKKSRYEEETAATWISYLYNSYIPSLYRRLHLDREVFSKDPLLSHKITWNCFNWLTQLLNASPVRTKVWREPRKKKVPI